MDVQWFLSMLQIIVDMIHFLIVLNYIACLWRKLVVGEVLSLPSWDGINGDPPTRQQLRRRHKNLKGQEMQNLLLYQSG